MVSWTLRGYTLYRELITFKSNETYFPIMVISCLLRCRLLRVTQLRSYHSELCITYPSKKLLLEALEVPMQCPMITYLHFISSKNFVYISAYYAMLGHDINNIKSQ